MSGLPPSSGGGGAGVGDGAAAAAPAAAAAAPAPAAPAPPPPAATTTTTTTEQQQPQRLYLAVHTVENVSARVPFSIILLMDAQKRRAIPEAVGRVRMIIPSDGRESVSLWDAAAPGPLQQWLSANLGPDCIVQVYGVEEDFCVGVGLELARARAADRTQRAAERAGQAVAQRVQELDRSTGLVAGARETTQAAAARVSDLARRAAEDERVQRAAAQVSVAATQAWSRISTWVAERQAVGGGGGGGGGAVPVGGYGDPFAAAGGGGGGRGVGVGVSGASLDPLDTPPAAAAAAAGGGYVPASGPPPPAA